MYGSAARRKLLPGWDIDLLVVTSTPRLRSVQANFAGQALDLFLGNADGFRQLMQRDVKGNGNFILRALVHGRIMRDLDGSFAALTQLAHKQWADGPSAAGEGERRLILARCLKISATVRRLLSIPASDAANAQLREVQVSVFLEMLTQDFCRIQRRWASSLGDMAESAEFGELQTMLGEYMFSSDPCERLIVVEEMSQRVAECCKSASLP